MCFDKRDEKTKGILRRRAYYKKKLYKDGIHVLIHNPINNTTYHPLQGA